MVNPGQGLPALSTIDGYTTHRVLGKGFSAQTKLATDASGKQFALKIFDKTNPQFNATQFKLLKQEVENASHLQHPNVVSYASFSEDTQEVKGGKSKNVAYIAMEPIMGGELFDYIANSGKFGEKFSRHFFKQMLMGLNYIHSSGFSHRDLKPENILLGDDYTVKIIDFGFACPLEGRDGSGLNRTHVGTPGYMAPEILAKKPYQASSVDLFALGVILFIMYAGHPPFSLAQDSDPYYKLLASQRADMFWKAHQHGKPAGFFTPEFMDLITAMLQLQPHNRLCMADVVAHPWLLGEFPTNEEVQAEFERRHQVNKDIAKEEEDRKRQMQERVNAESATHRGVEVGGQTYLDATDATDEEMTDSNIKSLQLKEYSPDAVNSRLCFFSTFKPNQMLSEMKTYFKGEKQEITMSDKSWKFSYEISQVIDKENPDFVETARVQIRFLQVPNTDKICVDLQRVGGSMMLFHDSVKKLKQELNLCINTTL